MQETVVSYTLIVDGLAPIALTIHGPCTVSDADQILLASYLPGGVIVPGKPLESEIQVTLHSVPNGRWGAWQNNQEITLWYPASDAIPIAIWMAISAFLRGTWLSQRIFPAHAVALLYGSDAVILAGHSGVGKSTVGLACVSRGARLLTGNRSLISCEGDGFALQGGTYTATVRAADGDALRSIAHPLVTYGARVAMQIDPVVQPIRIARFILPLVAPENWCEEVAYPSSLHRLLPHLLDLDNSVISLGDGDGVVTGSIDPTVQHTMIATLAHRLPAVPVYAIGGSVSYISGEIERIGGAL